MLKLTLKQKRFADEYIISGNATQSAIKAGYSEKTAGVIGDENLKKPYISEYIKNRLEKLNRKKTMDLQEAIERTSSIARGEVQKGYSKSINKLTGEVEKERVFYYTPTVEEQQRSLDHIMRCNGAFVDKLKADINLPVVISGGEKLED